MNDEYDVSSYTDEQLYRVLDLNNPSDRELEAKILTMIRKYGNFKNESGNKLVQFFIDIYNRFFEHEETEDVDREENAKEGFQTQNSITPQPSATTATTTTPPQKDNVNLTKTLDYSKDQLNPLLKQTIKRIISIDSHYRDNQTNTSSTNFTFNLSEPLKDVVSLSLYSIQIPYTWYTVNSDFGGNFFYLKGSSPGINNGNYNYQISIPSGNYTPIGIVNAVNVGFKSLINTNFDISFGNTQAIYNNGISDATSGTGKCALLIDITKVFNTGNFDLSFSEWSSPINNADRLTTLAGYFGFNDPHYYCSSIYSDLYDVNVKTDIFSVSTKLNYFYVVPYVGSSYLNCDISYSSVKVEVNLGLITSRTTVGDFINILDSAMYNNQNFDYRFTSCKIIDLSSNQYGFGNSYTLLKCKLNDKYAPIVTNLKLAAVFPCDANSLFYGSPSACAFLTDLSDNSGNVVCEFNELVAQSPILQSSFDSSNAIIKFKCDASGYRDNSYNDFNISIASSNNYTLSGFINAVNNAALTQLPNFYRINPQFINKIPDGIFVSMDQDSSSFLNIYSNFSMVYNNVNYQVYVTYEGTTSYLINFFDFSTNPVDIASPSNYTNPNYQASNLSFTDTERLYIVPKRTPSGNSNADPFVIEFPVSSVVYGDIYSFRNYLYAKITSFIDPITGTRPLSGSNIIVNSGNQMTLTLQISYTITPSFYVLELHANSNIWRDLSFNNFPYIYRLFDYSNNNYTINSNGVIRNNEFIIRNGVNDTFYVNPSNQVDVFYSSGNTYSVSITIPDTSTNGGGTAYIITDLITIINNAFSINAISNGSNISLITRQNGQSFVKFKFNFNVIFTTKDFNLVFYDPYSFAKCISNRNASSLQNATWDSTLGWLLGYRNLISYSLSEYVGTNYPSGTMFPSNYYLSDNSNVCVLIGDTNVSTNLYNYFLIMLDDYVQNHLNDGLVTITNQEKVVNPGPHIYICDPSDPTSSKKIAVPADYGSPGINYTMQQLYAFNQQVQSQAAMLKSYSTGPFVQDIFGLIPVKTSGLTLGTAYIEFGGTLQNQQRLYFGPVNIHRMTIKLLNDRGSLVDLNKNDWSFSFVCEQLYKSGVS